jgi:uncharacterized DUF497 family protein
LGWGVARKPNRIQHGLPLPQRLRQANHAAPLVHFAVHDPDHSEDEERFVLLGLSSAPRLLLVCHCYRSAGNVIRIISARKATRAESESYP